MFVDSHHSGLSPRMITVLEMETTLTVPLTRHIQTPSSSLSLLFLKSWLYLSNVTKGEMIYIYRERESEKHTCFSFIIPNLNSLQNCFFQLSKIKRRSFLITERYLFINEAKQCFLEAKERSGYKHNEVVAT